MLVATAAVSRVYRDRVLVTGQLRYRLKNVTVDGTERTHKMSSVYAGT